MADNDNIADAVKDAVEKDNKPVEKEVIPPVVEEVEEEEVEIDASAEEINNALVFFRSLNNPAERDRLISSLAREGGYDLSKKAEVKQLTRDAKAILKEKLGANYDVLNGDQLAEAFEELVSSKVTELTKPVIDRITITEQRANDEKAGAAMSEFFKRNEITEQKERESVSEKMLVKMKTMPAAPGSDVNEYLDDLYHLISRNKDEAKGVKRTITRIRQNARDSSRLSGEGTGNEERIKQGSHVPDLDESVRAAFAGKKLE